MHVSRRVENIEVVSRSRRPRDRERSPVRTFDTATIWLHFERAIGYGQSYSAALAAFSQPSGVRS